MPRARSMWIAAVLATVPLWAQAPPTTAPATPAKKIPAGLGGGPSVVNAYLVTAEIEFQGGESEAPPSASPEAAALMKRLQGPTRLVSRYHLSGDISRQEILSEDFVLPKGTIVMHKAGDRYYAVIDPKQQTFLPLDAETVLNALEGGAGVENSQYEIKVQHQPGTKMIAGLECRHSIVNVAYVSSIPFENERVFVQQKNDIEVWHTTTIPSASALEHLFFKFQRDKTGEVRRALTAEIAFPMEVTLVATQGKRDVKAPGSFRMVVTEALKQTLETSFFVIPPAGYRRIDRNPYFTAE